MKTIVSGGSCSETKCGLRCKEKNVCYYSKQCEQVGYACSSALAQRLLNDWNQVHRVTKESARCAVVSRSEELLLNEWGADIDSKYDLVFRVGPSAPILGFESFVGSKTQFLVTDWNETLDLRYMNANNSLIVYSFNSEKRTRHQGWKKVAIRRCRRAAAHAGIPSVRCLAVSFVTGVAWALTCASQPNLCQQYKPSAEMVAVLLARHRCHIVHLFGFERSHPYVRDSHYFRPGRFSSSSYTFADKSKMSRPPKASIPSGGPFFSTAVVERRLMAAWSDWSSSQDQKNTLLILPSSRARLRLQDDMDESGHRSMMLLVVEDDDKKSSSRLEDNKDDDDDDGKSMPISYTFRSVLTVADAFLTAIFQ